MGIIPVLYALKNVTESLYAKYASSSINVHGMTGAKNDFTSFRIARCRLSQSKLLVNLIMTTNGAMVQQSFKS